MRRLALIAILATVVGLGPAVPAGAANHNVVLTPSLNFEPARLTIQVGDTVTWTNNGGSHNVRADDGSFRCSSGCDGEGGDGSPSGANWSFSRTFNQPADIPYHCEVHGAAGGAGMSGRVIVQGEGEAPQEPGAVFADGFESGDTCAWSDRENLPRCNDASAVADGNFLRVTEEASRARSGGRFGLESVYGGGLEAAYLVDDTPDDLNRFRVSFWVQPDREFSMEQGATHVILEARQRSNPRRVFTVSLEGQRKSKVFRARLGAETEAGFEDHGSIKIKRGKWKRVTVDWKAAAEDGSSPGFVCVTKKDACPQGKRREVENPSLVIDSVRFGQVERLDAATGGTVYLDDYSSHTAPQQGGEGGGEEEGGNSGDGADGY